MGTLYLTGFRIDPDIYEPQFYTLYVDEDGPIMSAGCPVLFSRPELAAEAYRISDCDKSEYTEVPNELYIVYDLTEAIYVIDALDEAPSSSILNCLNVILDFANCLPDELPPLYRTSIEKLADQLTFEYSFGAFLEASGISRKDIVDGIYWCFGHTLYQMKFLT